MGSANSSERGTMLPVRPAEAELLGVVERAPVDREAGRRAAPADRCQGEPASHWSRKSRKKMALLRTAISLSPGVRRTSSAMGPLRK